MPTSNPALDALRAHTCWSHADLALREARVAARYERQYKVRNAAVQSLFFLATACAGQALLWQTHDLHAALLPYIVLITIAFGYFAYSQGMANTPPAVMVSLWRQLVGAVALDAGELAEVDAALEGDAELRAIVQGWRSQGLTLCKRDAEAIGDYLLGTAGEAAVQSQTLQLAPAIALRIPGSPDPARIPEHA